jgi:enamine deaminase RidA (YjgF/YER057c/UK114 family)
MLHTLAKRRIVAIALLLGASMPVSAQSSAPAASAAPVPPPQPKLLDPPERVPAPGGEVVFALDQDKQAYDQFHFSFVRRAGDFIYFSGRVAGIRAGSPYDIETYKSSVRRLFRFLGDELHAVGADYKDIVMIHSFHAFRNGNDGPENKRAQFQAFSAVKDEFMQPPYPAWTAVGVDAILVDGALTEADFVAYAPQEHSKPKRGR